MGKIMECIYCEFSGYNSTGCWHNTSKDKFDPKLVIVCASCNTYLSGVYCFGCKSDKSVMTLHDYGRPTYPVVSAELGKVTT